MLIPLLLWRPHVISHMFSPELSLFHLELISQSDKAMLSFPVSPCSAHSSSEFQPITFIMRRT